MSYKNVPVIVQKANKSKSRKRVGTLNYGSKPEYYDYDIWGVEKLKIISEGFHKISWSEPNTREDVYLIVEI